MFEALLECVFEPVGETLEEWFVDFLSGFVLKGVEMVGAVWNVCFER
jgi:hypothetical protein